jgi:hypothetical protein
LADVLAPLRLRLQQWNCACTEEYVLDPA